jgi:hypothetical protein
MERIYRRTARGAQLRATRPPIVAAGDARERPHPLGATLAGGIALTLIETLMKTERIVAERNETIAHPAGILSSRDFLAYVAAGFERLVDRNRYERALAEGADPYDHLGGAYQE